MVVFVVYNNGEPTTQNEVYNEMERDLLIKKYNNKIFLLSNKIDEKTSSGDDATNVTTPRRPDYLKRFYRK